MVTHLLVSRHRGAFACAAVLAALTASPCSHAQTMTFDSDYHPQFRAPADIRVFPQEDGNLAATGVTYLGDARVAGVIRFTPDGTVLDDDGPRDTTPVDSWVAVRLSDGRTVRAELRSTLYGWEQGNHRFAFITTDATGATLASFEVAAIPVPGWGTTPPAHSVKLEVLPDGRVMAGGNFTGGLLRIAADGTRDIAFTPSSAASDGWFRDLLVRDDGSTVLARGGDLDELGATGPAPLLHILSDGSLDTAFAATLDEPSLHLAQAGGKILVGGTQLRRLGSDGAVDSTFDATAAGFERIISVRAVGDGTLLVAGAQAGNTPAVCVLDEDGALVRNLRDLFDGDAVALDGLDVHGIAWVRHGPSGFTARTWVYDHPWDVRITKPRLARVPLRGPHSELHLPTEVTITPEPLVDGAVNRLLSDAAGRIVVSGTFDRIDGSAYYRIARLLPDGSVDSAFAPNNLGAGAFVSVVHPDGRMLVGNPSDDGASSYGRLLADGSSDPTFATDSALAAGDNVTVVAVTADGGYVATHQMYDDPYTVGLFRFRADGSLAWMIPNPGGIVGIWSTGVTAEGRIVIGGSVPAESVPPGGIYTDGNSAYRARLIALRVDDGTVDDTYGPQLPAGATLQWSKVRNDGSALVAINEATDALAIRTRIVRLQSDGSVDSAFRLSPEDEAILRDTYEIPIYDGGFLAFLWQLVLAGHEPAFLRWRSDGTSVPEFSAWPPAEEYTSVLLTSDDVLYSAGHFSWGEMTTPLVRSLPTRMPGIVRQPNNATTTAGESVALITAVGDGGTVTYQWQRDGVDIEGATSSRLFLDRIQASDAGSYRCVIRAGDLVYVTNAAAVIVSPSTAKLVNFSARSRVDAEHTQIGGIVVNEASGQPALLRAVGNGLGGMIFQVPLLSDPLLTLYRDNTAVAQDFGGGSTEEILALGDSLGAFRPYISNTMFPPITSALAQTLAPGVYTVHTTSKGAQAGVSLFEYYDAGPAAPGRGVANLSIRAPTGPGADVLIAGFVINGTGNAPLLIRAVGPGLDELGVPNAARDPRIIVRASDRAAPDATNDDWSGDPEIAAAGAEAGAFELAPDSKDAALVLSLPAGAYTVQVPAAGDERGEVLVEIYVLDR